MTGMMLGHSRQRGMTLVELMVAMLIGTVLIGGAISVYIQSRANFRTADSVARLQENVRFALDALEPDIRLARFWGLNNQPAFINPTGVVISCTGGTNLQATTFATQFIGAVESRDDLYDLDCAGLNPRGNSDVLIVRHASARITAPSVGQVQVESNLNGGQLFDDAIPPAADLPAEIRDVVVNAYYIGDSSFDPALPALRRLSLVDGGAQGRLQDQEVIPGVENLQVQFGIDTNGNRDADRYVDGDNPLAAPGAAGAEIVAVRLWMLVRSETDEAGLAFVDDRVYTPADANLPPIDPGTTAGFPETFRRLAVSKTVFLRNSGGIGGP